MVLWCRCCGALIGVRYPYTDWTVDRDSVCKSCAERECLVEPEQQARAWPHRIPEDAETATHDVPCYSL